MNSYPPALLGQVIHDSSAYGAVVADACVFNRGLTRSRASRLPFLDLATHTIQKPAPWLYRTCCERSKDKTETGTHVVLRYLRHRWCLDQQSPAKKRKLAADRLWYTLKSGLTALGVPLELIPLVTKRAYILAGLPVPPSLAPHLESLINKSGNGVLPATSSSNTVSANPSASIRLQTSVTSNVVQTTTRRGPTCEFWADGRRAGQMLLEDGEPSMDEPPVDESELSLKQNFGNISKSRSGEAVLPTVTSGDDSFQSADNGVSRRTNNEHGLFEPKTDDDISVQSGNGHSNSEPFQIRNKYDLEEDSDEGEDDEDDDFEDDELDDDDVEWVQPRGRRSYTAFSVGRSLHSKRQHRTLSPRKGSGFSSVATRLSDRRVVRGPYSVGHREKSRSNRSTDKVIDMAVSNSRRNARLPTGVLKPKSVPPAPIRSTKDCLTEELWDSFPEPGFQPNANLSSLPGKSSEEPGSTPHSTEHFIRLSDSAYYSASPLHATTLVTESDNSTSSREIPGIFQTDVPHGADQRRHPQMSVSSQQSVPRAFSSVASASSQPIAASLPFNAPVVSRTTMSQLLSSGTTSTGGSAPVPPSSSSGPFGYHSVVPSDAVHRDCSEGRETNSRVVTISPMGQPTKMSYQKDSNAATTCENPILNSGLEFQSAGRPSSSRADAFTAPQGATTTVTFFVCEVCASRYRSTAGLRYHYHSQHSGYTPKNPISASASRLVVPVGEERGIGGGLRGGRPRRHKAPNIDGRSTRMRNKDFESKSPNRVGPPDVLNSIPSSSGVDGLDRFRDPSFVQHSANGVASELHMHSFSPNYVSPVNSCADSVTRSTNESSAANRISSVRPYMRASVEYCSSTPLNEAIASKSTDQSAPFCSEAGPDGPGSSTSISINSSLGQDGTLELNRATTPQRIPSMQTVCTVESSTSTFGIRTQPYSAGPSFSQSSNSSCTAQMSWLPQESYGTPSHPGQSSYSQYRMSPNQRRFERQRCPDRSYPSHTSSLSCVPTCVYCLGDDRLNPRIGRPEGLLRCSRCNTWAHFSCLHLPTHVVDNATRYPWQCIECKSCWLCGSPEHENRMIFCGDCDRSFHVDCLPAPLPRLRPGAHWTCDICLHDLYTIGDPGAEELSGSAGPSDNQPFYPALSSHHTRE